MWRAAIAAAALIGIGTFAIYSAKVLPDGFSSGPASGRSSANVNQAAGKFVVISDPDLILMDEIEIFDEVGNAPTRLVADWGR